MAKKKPVKKTNEINTSPLNKLMQWISSIYIFVVLSILPLYTPDGYYGIGDNKWIFWIRATSIYVAIILFLGIIYLIMGICGSKYGYKLKKKEQLLHQISILDWFVMAYILVVLIGAATSPFKEGMWVGAEGWNMGIWSQLCFVLAYFCITRTWTYSNGIFRWAIATGALVCLYAVLMRFDVDPLGFYDGLSDIDKFNYISTLGQTSWYSSYLCLIMPVSIIAYMTVKSTLGRIISSIPVILGFMSTVTQNSDSAYLAFAAYMFALLWIAFENDDYMQRLLEILLICLASFKFIGIMQMIFVERATQLDAISMNLSQGVITWIALIAVAIVYVLFILGKKKKGTMNVSKFKWIRVVLLIITIVMAFAGVAYIALNTQGLLPASVSSENNYLVFDNAWGNNRGVTWRAAVGTIISEPFGRKLIGYGPDTFGGAAYTYFKEEIDSYFMELTGMHYVVYCAHNEWLNTFVTCGLFGLIAYLGMYITCFVKCMKNGKKDAAFYGIAAAIAAYIAHNLFCYQQVICTSVIIVFIAAAEGLTRNGHVESDSWEWNPSGQKLSIKSIFKQFMNL